jgi:hypothetical protein
VAQVGVLAWIARFLPSSTMEPGILGAFVLLRLETIESAIFPADPAGG